MLKVKKRYSLREVITRLNEFLVDNRIENSEARNFWKKHFLSEETGQLEDVVKFSYFRQILMKSLCMDRKQLQGLQALLCWDWKATQPAMEKTTKLTIEKFDLVTKILGPFFLQEHAGILREITKWVSQLSYFQGIIDKATAELRLHYRPEGTYLVKLSETRVGYPFTVMYIDSKGLIKLARVKLDKSTNGHYLYKVVPPHKILDEVKYYDSLQGAILASGLKLTMPCPKEKNMVSDLPY